MGNVLAVAPSSDYALYDVPDLAVVRSCGGSRLFKSVQCVSERDGQMYLVKTVAKLHLDASTPTSTYASLIQSTAGASSASVRIEENARCVRLIRPFAYATLGERIGMRPFLSSPLKLWIAFQLVRELHSLHMRGSCHGDLKTSNVTVSTFLAVRLVDHAPFKPAACPRDDPSIFSFFFDTARGRLCCLAPERITYNSFSSNSSASSSSNGSSSSSNSGSSNSSGGSGAGATSASGSIIRVRKDLMDEKQQQQQQQQQQREFDDDQEEGQDRQRSEVIAVSLNSLMKLTPEMDVFSLGCVLYELFTDGRACFDYAQLLAYAALAPEQAVLTLAEKLKLIDDPAVRNLLAGMLAQQPEDRIRLSDVLSSADGLFPQSFHCLWEGFTPETPDSRVESVVEYLKQSSTSTSQKPDPILAVAQCILCTSLVHLSTVELQLVALSHIVSISQIMLQGRGKTFAGRANLHHDDSPTSFAIPFILACCSDPATPPMIIARCVHALAQLHCHELREVTNATLTSPHALVRCALAATLGDFALAAKYDQERSHMRTIARLHGTLIDPATFEHETDDLLEEVSTAVVSCAQHSDEAVRISLLHGTTRLCLFYGHRKTISFLLPLLISMLNQGSQHVRGAFLEYAVPQAAVFVGPQATESFLLPCVLQSVRGPKVDPRAKRALEVLLELQLVTPKQLFILRTTASHRDRSDMREMNAAVERAASQGSNAPALSPNNSNHSSTSMPLNGTVSGTNIGTSAQLSDPVNREWEEWQVEGPVPEHLRTATHYNASIFALARDHAPQPILSLSAFSDLFVSCSPSHVRLWSLSRLFHQGAGLQSNVLHTHAGNAMQQALFLKNEYRVATSTGALIDIASTSEAQASFAPCDRLVSPAEQVLLTGSEGTLAVVDLRMPTKSSLPQHVASWKYPLAYGNLTALSAREDYAVMGTHTGYVVLYDLRYTGLRVGHVQVKGHVWQLGEMERGCVRVAGGRAGHVVVDLRTVSAGEPSLYAMDDVSRGGENRPESDCRSLAGGDLCGWADGSITPGFGRVHEDAVTALAECAEHVLVSASRDGVVKLWR